MRVKSLDEMLYERFKQEAESKPEMLYVFHEEFIRKRKEEFLDNLVKIIEIAE